VKNILIEYKEVSMQNVQLELELSILRQRDEVTNASSTSLNHSIQNSGPSIDSLTISSIQNTLSNLQLQFTNTMEAMNSASSLLEDFQKQVRMP